MSAKRCFDRLVPSRSFLTASIQIAGPKNDLPGQQQYWNILESLETIIGDDLGRKTCSQVFYGHFSMAMFHLQAEPTECAVVFPILSSKPMFESASEPSPRDMDWRPDAVPTIWLWVVTYVQKMMKDVDRFRMVLPSALNHKPCCNRPAQRSRRWSMHGLTCSSATIAMDT